MLWNKVATQHINLFNNFKFNSNKLNTILIDKIDNIKCDAMVVQMLSNQARKTNINIDPNSVYILVVKHLYVHVTPQIWKLILCEYDTIM